MLIGVTAKALSGKPTFMGDRHIEGIDKPFHVLMDERGIRLPVRVMHNGIVRVSSRDEIEAAAKQFFIEEILHVDPYFQWTKAEDSTQAYRQTIMDADPIAQEEIVGIAEKSYKGYAYAKLTFDLDQPGETPTFDRLFSNMSSNAEAIMMWIGSLFDPESDRSQYVYLYGPGGNGKGRLIHFLTEVLGSAHVPCVAPSQSNARFFYQPLYNKRLATFSDVNDYKIVMSSEVKTLTGDDYVLVDMKGGAIFKAKVFCKLMFASNHEPQLSSFEHDMRRIIATYMPAIPKDQMIPQREMDARLKAEGPAFLSKCWQMYLEKAKDIGLIPCDRDIAEAIADKAEMDFVDALEQYFVVDPDLIARRCEINRIVEILGWKESKAQAFMNWIDKKYGNGPRVVKVKRNRLKQMPRGYYGLGVLPEYRDKIKHGAGKGKPEAPLQPAFSKRDEAQWDAFVKEYLGTDGVERDY